MGGKKKKVFIIEDNGLNRASLESILRLNDFEITGSKSTAESAWEELQLISVDIVLIDIHLAGEEDGVWLAEKIRAHKNLPFIYLTAYGDAKTIEKIKNTKPNGYLMKPYNTPTLLTTIQIAIDSFRNYNSSLEDKNEEKIIYIKDKYTRIKIDISEIEYIKSDGNYVSIVMEKKKYLVRGKLLDFKKELLEDTFLQVHQRYVINTGKISSVGKSYVKINDIEIPVSKRYKEPLNKKLNVF